MADKYADNYPGPYAQHAAEVGYEHDQVCGCLMVEEADPDASIPVFVQINTQHGCIYRVWIGADDLPTMERVR